MDFPDPPVRTIAAAPAQGGRSFLKLLRMLAAGCMTALLLGAVPLADWAETDSQVPQITAIQSVTTAMKNVTESLGLAKPYAWIRQQTRALEHFRFGPPEDQQ